MTTLLPVGGEFTRDGGKIKRKILQGEVAGGCVCNARRVVLIEGCVTRALFKKG